MDAQELRNLQEAYLGVYIQEEIDSWVDELVEEGYGIDEYADEELLEAFLDERKNEDPKGVANRAGVNKPDAWGPPTKFGQEATRGSLAHGMRGVRTLQRAGVRINRHHRQNYLAHQVHKGWASAAENSPHQTPEQQTRRKGLINKDLNSFRKNLSKKERKKDVPFVKKAERAVNKQGEFAEQVDLYDIILDHLLDEGYAETSEAAEVIMVNMSEEWREGILDEANRGDEYATRGMSSDDAITAKIRRRNSAGGYNPDEPRRIERSPTGPIGGGANSRRDQTKRNRGKRTDLVPDSDNPSRLERRVGGPKGGTKNPEVVGTNKHLRSQNFKRNPPKRSTSYYDN